MIPVGSRGRAPSNAIGAARAIVADSFQLKSSRGARITRTITTTIDVFDKVMAMVEEKRSIHPTNKRVPLFHLDEC